MPEVTLHTKKEAQEFVDLQFARKTPATQDKPWYTWYTKKETEELLNFIFGE